MKRIIFFAGLYIISLAFQGCSSSGKEPKPTGLPGDNLDLYAVLDLFKSSTSVEAFEKSLNDKSTGVNNLDLNGDGKVDYIRVVDQHDSDSHAITLRVPVAQEESQDIAVIEIEKTGDKTASIQVIGDEDMYGKDYIIEPKGDNDKAGFIYASSSSGVNVWLWPSVSYVYSPSYVVWESPYRYEYYPVYWSPWEPVAYDVYYPAVYKNHGQYVAFGQPRFKHANEIYYSNRMSSGFVMERRKGGDFKEGKQPHYTGNNFPKGSPDRQPGNNGRPENGPGGQNAKEDHHDGPKMNNDKRGNEPGGGNRNKGNDRKIENHSQKNDGSSQRSAAPRGGNSKPKGGGHKDGGAPKGGGSHKGGGGRHK